MNKKDYLLRSLFACKKLCYSYQLDIELDFGSDLDKFPDEKLHEYSLYGFIHSSLQDIFDCVKEQFPNDLPNDFE